jgi:hypothetical protein
LPVELECAPQEPQISPVAVSPPPPSPLAPTSLIVSPLVSDVWHITAIFDTNFSRPLNGSSRLMTDDDDR